MPSTGYAPVPPNQSMVSAHPWFLLAVLLACMDQLTKQCAIYFLSPAGSIVLTSFLSISLAYNTGIAFSLLAHQHGWLQYALVMVDGLIMVAIGVGLCRYARDRWRCFAFSLLLGGGLGNVVDRVFQGGVTDFIMLHWQQYYWPTFNFADACITVGAGLLCAALVTEKS